MDILKWLALGVGGFVLYEYFFGGTATTATATATTTTTPVTTTPAAPALSANAINAQAAIARTSALALVLAATNAGYPAPQNFTASQWNYFFTQLTGAPSWGLGDNGQPMSIGTYWNLLTSSAAALQGLGMIISLSDLYSKSAPGSGFGDEEFLSAGMYGNGLGVIVDDPNNSAAYIDETGMVAASQFAGSQDSTTSDFYLAVQAGGLTVYDS